jgi:hypothetical protein
MTTTPAFLATYQRALHEGADPTTFEQRMRAQFRAAQLYATRDGGAVQIRVSPGVGGWLCVFTSLESMANVIPESDYFSLLGADMLDNVIPVLSAASGDQLAGVMVDIGAEHMLPLPIETLRRWRGEPPPAAQAPSPRPALAGIPRQQQDRQAL